MKSPEILRRLVQRFGLLLALTLIGGAAGGTYGAVKAPTYTAKAFVVAIGDPGDSISALNFAQAYGRIATSGPVLALAGSELGDRSGLADVTASTSPDAPVVEITSTGRSAARTAVLANAMANALIDVGNTRKTDTHVTLDLLAAATVPVTPSSPKPPLELAVGAAAGLLVGGLTVLAGIGRASAVPAKAVTADSGSAPPPEIDRYVDGWRTNAPQRAIASYRSQVATAGGTDDLGSKVIAFEPIVVRVDRVVGRATVAGAEDEQLENDPAEPPPPGTRRHVGRAVVNPADCENQ